jgi:ABC-type multidrug transport system permease subunit
MSIKPRRILVVLATIVMSIGAWEIFASRASAEVGGLGLCCSIANGQTNCGNGNSCQAQGSGQYCCQIFWANNSDPNEQGCDWCGGG